jgi:hypothetical protein
VLGLLENIVEIIGNVPAYILYAIETIINIVFSGIQAVFSLATSLIPLPATPVPSFIPEINWFFPIGSVVSIMTPIVSGYVLFLAVRYIFKKVGDL